MKHNSRILFIILPLVLIICLAGCCTTYNMPFNGDMVFHDFSLTIPENFIRDSTQSNDDQWIFECGMYQQLIILKRTTATESAPEDLENLMLEYVTTGGIATSIEPYENAYRTQYNKDGVDCHEVLFIYGDSVYCFAMHGVTEEEFTDFLNTITVQGTNT